ncbi:MAG: permease-like cell division protein FtsX, partial [Gallionella sp.]|nr:permease-like cell division protein FtsX [Gallionella sp.]
MTRAFAQHLGVLRAVLRRMFASPLAGFLNILVIGIALSLPAGMYLLLQNAQGLVAQFSGTPQISLFLGMDVKTEDVDRLRKQLAQHPAIAGVEFVARAQALEQLEQSTGLADVIGGLEKNPLPDAFIVHPKPGDVRALNGLRDELAKLSGVELAQLDSDWAYKLEALLKFGRLAVLIFASLLSLALIAVTFNTIR